LMGKSSKCRERTGWKALKAFLVSSLRSISISRLESSYNSFLEVGMYFVRRQCDKNRRQYFNKRTELYNNKTPTQVFAWARVNEWPAYTRLKCSPLSSHRAEALFVCLLRNWEEISNTYRRLTAWRDLSKFVILGGMFCTKNLLLPSCLLSAC
jgi:hypothetical protein